MNKKLVFFILLFLSSISYSIEAEDMERNFLKALICSERMYIESDRYRDIVVYDVRSKIRSKRSHKSKFLIVWDKNYNEYELYRKDIISADQTCMDKTIKLQSHCRPEPLLEDSKNYKSNRGGLFGISAIPTNEKGHKTYVNIQTGEVFYEEAEVQIEKYLCDKL